MKITRHSNESICINHQMTITVHEHTARKCCLYITDHLTGNNHMEVLAHHEELVISDYNTVMTPISFDLDAAGFGMTTFAINHDPNVLIHRSEMEVMQ